MGGLEFVPPPSYVSGSGKNVDFRILAYLLLLFYFVRILPGIWKGRLYDKDGQAMKSAAWCTDILCLCSSISAPHG